MIVHAIIERKSGAAPAKAYGRSIGAMGLDALDRYLEGAAAPLSSFMHEDATTLEQALQVAQPMEKPALERRLAELRSRPDWHDPREGLKTVQTLLDRLPHDDRHAGVRDDLKTYLEILTAAAEADDPFRLNVRTTD